MIHKQTAGGGKTTGKTEISFNKVEHKQVDRQFDVPRLCNFITFFYDCTCKIC